MDVNPTVIIVMGVSGSGKTTIGSLLAKQLNWNFQDADAFHPAANIDKMSQGTPLTDDDRVPWLKAMRGAIRTWLAENDKTVLACSALKEAYRQSLQVDDVKVKFVYLKGSFGLLMTRLQGRQGHFMKAQMLRSQLSTLEEPKNTFIANASKSPDQIVSDIRSRFGI